MLTVKQVATALGIDERSVREKLNLGTLKGIKKNVGQREQWFIHQRDLDAELARRGLTSINPSSHTPEQSYKAPEMFSPYVTPGIPHQRAEIPPQPFASPHPNGNPNQYGLSQPPQPPEIQPTMSFRPYVPEPPAPPKQQQTATAEVEDFTDATVLEELANGSIFDQNGAEDAEVSTSGGSPRSWRNEELENQVMATAEKIMRPLMERVEELTREIVLKDLEIEEKDKQLKLLPDFEAQRKKLLADIEAERKAAEIQFNKVREKEEEARALEAENSLLKQKAEEAVLSAAKLAELEKVVQELKKPKPGWFKRLFLPADSD